MNPAFQFPSGHSTGERTEAEFLHPSSGTLSLTLSAQMHGLNSTFESDLSISY